MGDIKLCLRGKGYSHEAKQSFTRKIQLEPSNSDGEQDGTRKMEVSMESSKRGSLLLAKEYGLTEPVALNTWVLIKVFEVVGACKHATGRSVCSRRRGI